MFLPSNRISPESGGSWPLIMLKQVDLPAPFGPIMARNSPGATSKLTSLTARTPPKALDSERTSSTLMACPAPAPERRESADEPCGNASTSSRMMAPNSARQYSVCRITVSCKVAKTEAPTIGPVSVWMPPSSTITRPSIERPTWMVSGEIEPLAKANSPPATPQTRAGNGEAEPMHALDVDADGLGAQRGIAPRPHGIAERREQKASQQQHADHRQRQRQQEIDPGLVERRRRPHADHAVGAAGEVLPTGTPPPTRSARRPSVSMAR